MTRREKSHRKGGTDLEIYDKIIDGEKVSVLSLFGSEIIGSPPLLSLVADGIRLSGGPHRFEY